MFLLRATFDLWLRHPLPSQECFPNRVIHVHRARAKQALCNARRDGMLMPIRMATPPKPSLSKLERAPFQAHDPNAPRYTTNCIANTPDVRRVRIVALP